MTATLETIAQSALSSIETVNASYDVAWMAIGNAIPGDFVECGVYAGAQAAVMARAIMDYGGTLHPSDPLHGNQRRVHLFDSFTGIPAGGEHDTEWLAAGHQPGHSACSLEAVQANMKRWGIDESLLVYHEGMFHETIPIALRPNICYPWRIERIALLRLDGDLYESTSVCIQHLYPLVSPGGWVIVDDWDLSGARKAVAEAVGQFGPVYFQRQPYNICK